MIRYERKSRGQFWRAQKQRARKRGHIRKDEREKLSVNQLARIITGDVKIDERERESAIELAPATFALFVLTLIRHSFLSL